jgi:hypothetical protein
MREPFCRELTKTMENNLLLERIVERSMVGLLNIQCKFPSFSSQKPSAFQFIHHVALDTHLICPLLSKAALAPSACVDGAARSRNQKMMTWLTSKSGTYKVGMYQ